MPTLLLVDDEPNVLYSVQKSLESDTLRVLTASTGRQGIELARQECPDAAILDVRLADMSGLDVFDQLRQLHPRLPVVVITAYATTEVAIEAMKRGACEYLVKPVDLHKLRDVVSRAVELHRGHRPMPLRESGAAPRAEQESGLMIGRSAAMQEMYKAIGRVAPQDVNVLILGESGTGKEMVARALYDHSRRKGAPFLTINCAAIPDALLESELFGHERGAFTSADRRRIGKFEQANHGTLLLDEIGDMAPATQAKMLRLLQEQRFERLGSNDTIQVDVRMIAATNQNLETLVAAGRFRADLFYRLQVFTIRVPPLRERLDDLPFLVEHFIALFNDKLGKHVSEVTLDTLQLLRRHDWPGNVRELQSAIKYALVQAAGDLLTPEILPENLRHDVDLPHHSQPALPLADLDLVRFVEDLLQAGEPELYRKAILHVDRVVLEMVLRHVKGNQVQASELLGMSRTTLRTKLRALGMTLEKQLASESDQAVQKLASA